MLTPPLNSILPKIEGRLLIIVCSYRGGIGNPAPFSLAHAMPRLGKIGRLLDILLLLNLRRFIASNRDFFANPRSLKYQTGLIEELLQMTSPSQITIALDQALEADSARPALNAFGSVIVRDPKDLHLGHENVDAVVTIYPDALGLGWGALEADLMGTNTYLLNGRRRILPLNTHTKGKLRWRRMLAIIRAPELIASLLVIPLAAILAGLDALRGKS